MPRKPQLWFRTYVEMFSDRKIRRLSPAQRWLWTAMMGAARQSPDPGRLLVAEGLPMTRAELADYAAVREREIGPALTLMEQLGMVLVEPDGVITLPNFPKRQFESDSSSERVRKHRSNTADSDDVGTLQPSSKERSMNGRRNAPETETETETENTGGARKRAARIPEDWSPSAADIEWQRQEGIDDQRARRETEKFVDHWRSAGGQNSRKLDWSLAWRNWLRRAKDDGRFASPARPGTSMGQVSGGW